MMTNLSVFGQVDFDDLFVVVETQRSHRGEDILAIDGFTLLIQAFIGPL
jgi:hypothetical protein